MLSILTPNCFGSSGCEQFEPPIRGAFLCLRQPTIIYCSVLCDHRFEFFTTPHNPYFCGEETGFLWVDVTGTVVEGELPRCTGQSTVGAKLWPFVAIP